MDLHDTRLSTLTLSCPGSKGAVVIDEVVESERQDEEGAIAGRVHLKGDVPLVQTNRLTFLGQRCLQEFSSHLEEARSGVD